MIEKELDLLPCSVNLTSNEESLFRIIEYNIPSIYRETNLREKPTNINIHYKNVSAEELDQHLRSTSEVSFSVPELGFFREFDFENSTATVLHHQSQKTEDSWLYHVAFLQPLSILMGMDKATLVHGCLVSQGSSGTLLIGNSGVGKSTISTLLTEAGFTYFSDEHPILQDSSLGVYGLPFPNQISLEERVVRRLKLERFSPRWIAQREKYYIDPLKLGSIGKEKCLIKKILFPEFSETSKFHCQALSANELLRELKKEEYFCINYYNTDPVGIHAQHQLDMFNRLVSQAKGYKLRYGLEELSTLPDTIMGLSF